MHTQCQQRAGSECGSFVPETRSAQLGRIAEFEFGSDLESDQMFYCPSRNWLRRGGHTASFFLPSRLSKARQAAMCPPGETSFEKDYNACKGKGGNAVRGPVDATPEVVKSTIVLRAVVRGMLRGIDFRIRKRSGHFVRQ